MSQVLVAQNAALDQFRNPAVHTTLALLTSRQKTFVLGIMITGLSVSAAAKAAGYTSGAQGFTLMKNPNVMEAIATMQLEYANRLELDMDSVKEGMLDAINVARMTNNAMAMIAGWREIGKLIGAYVEPEKLITIDINDNRSLDNLPTAKLYEMLGNDVVEIVDEQQRQS